MPHTRAALEVGGWYWNSGSADLYQAQGRVFFTPQLGAQLAYIASTRTPGDNSYSGFLVYDLSSRQYSRKARPRWALEFGLGLFRDTSKDQSTGTNSDTTDFSLYVSGSLEIAPRISLNASQWYLRDRNADLNRFALGIGFSF